jgi:crossover junction endodeoxyribonuclease RusA
MRGRYIISQKGRDFRKQVQDALVGKPKTNGPIKLELEFHFKDRRIRDVDNYQKALIDALKGVLFEDDSQIFFLSASKTLKTAEKTVIRVSSIELDN